MHYTHEQVKGAASAARKTLTSAVSSLDQAAASDAEIFIDRILECFFRELTDSKGLYTTEQIVDAARIARNRFTGTLSLLGAKDLPRAASLADGLFHFLLDEVKS